jgi:hypothetical protein
MKPIRSIAIWLFTGTVTNVGQFYFDISATGQPVRFYRLVEPH